MRIRLVHTLSLMLVAIVGVAMLAFASLLAWNLRSGFSDYLEAADTAALSRFADVMGRLASEQGGVTALKSGRLNGAAVLDSLGISHRALPPPPLLGGFAPRPPPSGPAGSPNDRVWFPSRASIYTLDGQFLQGNAPPPGAPYAQALIRIDGVPAAEVRLLPRPPLPSGVEARFLSRQYAGIAGLAVLLFAGAQVLAVILARHWVRPLVAVQAATARIARGEHDVRLDEHRGDEIGDVMRDVNVMAASLATLEGARRRWIAEIAHELRTPLAVLRGELEALADGVRPIGPDAVRSLDDEVQRLSALVDDLHLLALSDLNALPFHPEVVDPAELAGRAIRRHARLATERGLELYLVPPAAELPAILIDARRLEQVLGNLLDNSLKYTDAPGCVRLRLEADTGTLRFVVEDSLPGVPLEAYDRLFDPLYRVDRTRNRTTGGSGLGLAICRALVIAQGGEISAGPSDLGGLSVCVTLPFAAVAP